MPTTPNALDPTRIYIALDPNTKTKLNHTLSSTVFGDAPPGGFISAPLPDGWGVPVENELTQPFTDFIPQGPIQTAMALLSVTGASLSQGYVVRKFFASTGIPDLTFDLSFVAYNDAFAEVITPVYWLYAWSAPFKTDSKTFDTKAAAVSTSVLQGLGKGIDDINSFFGINIPTTTGSTVTATEVADVVNWLDGPPEVSVFIGNAYDVGGIIISNMEPKFSNNLDFNGLPMQCDVSITLSLREPFTLNRVQTSYAQQFTGRR